MAGIAQSFFLSSLETVINRALLLDPITEHKVHQLSGKMLAVRTHTPEIVATVIFSGDSIQIFGDPDDVRNSDYSSTTSTADATIVAPAFTIASQALRTEDQGIDPDIKISGDRELVEKIHHIVSTLDVDWEEPLSQYIGDAAAHQVGQVGRDLFHWTKRTVRTFIADADVFIREEANIVAPNDDLESHATAVNEVHLKVDSLQQRVDKLQDKITGEINSITPQNNIVSESNIISGNNTVSENNTASQSKKMQNKDTDID